MAEKLSIVIPTHNCIHYLKMCLDSIKRNSVRDDHEIVICCDCCTDGTQEWLADNDYDFSEYNEPHAPSAEHALVMWHTGFRLALQPYVCFANDDQIFGPKWDEIITPYLAEDKVIGMQLIEPGTLGKPWRGLIEKSFGDTFKDVDIEAFEEFCGTLEPGTVEHEGVDISTVWHRDHYMKQEGGWPRCTVIDETQPFVRVTNAGVYHFSNKSRTCGGDAHLS